jgi:hypothetical protein
MRWLVASIFTLLLQLSFAQNSVFQLWTETGFKYKFNKELEAKEKLFNDKVSELKNLFEKQNLQSLNELKFEFSPKKYTLDGEEEETNSDQEGTTTGMVKE